MCVCVYSLLQNGYQFIHSNICLHYLSLAEGEFPLGGQMVRYKVISLASIIKPN